MICIYLISTKEPIGRWKYEFIIYKPMFKKKKNKLLNETMLLYVVEDLNERKLSSGQPILKIELILESRDMSGHTMSRSKSL
jgi:hypothetical protein